MCYVFVYQSMQPPPSSQSAPLVQSNVPRPTFPAYQNTLPASSASPAVAAAPPPLTTLPDVPLRPMVKVPPVGANSKLVHPEDDISMVCVKCTTKIYTYNETTYSGPFEYRTL